MTGGTDGLNDDARTTARLDPALSTPKRERGALAATSGAHFLHDGIADSLYVLLPIWAQSFGLNYTQVGSLKMAYSAAMAAFQMPAGVLAEAYGERTLLVAGTILAGGPFAGMALAEGFYSLFLVILVVGVCSAVQHPLSSTIISQAYPALKRRTALGVYNFVGDLGKMCVAFGVAVAAGAIGWQATATGYGVIVAAAGVTLFFVLQHYSLGQPRALESEPVAQPDKAVKLRGLHLTDARGFGLLSCIHAIDSAGRTGALTLLPFLLLQRGSSPATVGFALACIFAGGAVGKLACGLLADRIGIIRTVVITEIATAVVIGASLLLPLTLVIALMPLLGIALNGTSSVLYGTVTDFVPSDRQARAFGFFYTVGSAAGGSSPVMFGVLSDLLGLTQALLVLSVVTALTVPVGLMLRPHIANHAGRLDADE